MCPFRSIKVPLAAGTLYQTSGAKRHTHSYNVPYLIRFSLLNPPERQPDRKCRSGMLVACARDDSIVS